MSVALFNCVDKFLNKKGSKLEVIFLFHKCFSEKEENLNFLMETCEEVYDHICGEYICEEEKVLYILQRMNYEYDIFSVETLVKKIYPKFSQTKEMCKIMSYCLRLKKFYSFRKEDVIKSFMHVLDHNVDLSFEQLCPIHTPEVKNVFKSDLELYKISSYCDIFREKDTDTIVKIEIIGETCLNAASEIYLLKRMSHKNIAKISNIILLKEDSGKTISYGFSMKNYGLSLDNPTIASIVKNDIRVVAKEILSALRYIHDDIGIVHHDIKPQNILYDGNITLIDFGLSKPVNQVTDLSCSFGFEPPELQYYCITSEVFTGLIDIWAAGKTLSQFCNLPFLEKMLEEEVSKRYSAKKILERYF